MRGAVSILSGGRGWLECSTCKQVQAAGPARVSSRDDSRIRCLIARARARPACGTPTRGITRGEREIRRARLSGKGFFAIQGVYAYSRAP